MTQNFEKSVKGATKIKLAPPKSKYIEHILIATHTGEAGVAEIFRTLQLRLRDSTWTIVFKSLIVIHLMIRDGALDATLQFIAENPRKVAISSFSEVQAQGHNIRRYSEYLLGRTKAFSETKTDFVRNGQGRLKRLTVEKGLLRETECVQRQIKGLLRCNFLTDEVENEITLTAFRLLTLDLLVLYSVMNEGTINVLEHYFEMSRPDSEHALQIYKTFSTLTEEVVRFLGVARHFEAATRLEIPNLKHASTDLAQLLEDDLNDPDFELRRREYQVQKETKKKGQGISLTASKPTSAPTARVSNTAPELEARQRSASKPESTGPAPDLIDFFESIEQNQQPMARRIPSQQPNFQHPEIPFQQPMFQPQQSGFIPQQTGFQQQPSQSGFALHGDFGGNLNQPNSNPFTQTKPPQYLPPTPTSAGFGAYTSQPQSYSFQSNLSPIPQNGVATFGQPQQPMQSGQQQSSTNPFRQSVLADSPTASHAPTSPNPASPTVPLTRQNTNPFAKRLSSAPPQLNMEPLRQLSTLSQASAFQANPTLQPQAQPLQAQRTGTNPFSRSSSTPPQPTSGLLPPAPPSLRANPTGSTNPFRQSQFVAQQTGQGWHVNDQQGTIGGLELLETVPVFPRPGMN